MASTGFALVPDGLAAFTAVASVEGSVVPSRAVSELCEVSDPDEWMLYHHGPSDSEDSDSL